MDLVAASISNTIEVLRVGGFDKRSRQLYFKRLKTIGLEGREPYKAELTIARGFTVRTDRYEKALQDQESLPHPDDLSPDDPTVFLSEPILHFYAREPSNRRVAVHFGHLLLERKGEGFQPSWWFFDTFGISRREVARQRAGLLELEWLAPDQNPPNEIELRGPRYPTRIGRTPSVHRKGVDKVASQDATSSKPPKARSAAHDTRCRELRERNERRKRRRNAFKDRSKCFVSSQTPRRKRKRLV